MILGRGVIWGTEGMKMSEKTKAIIIPALKKERVKIKVRGITPLIMNKHSEEAQKKIEDKEQGRATKGRGTRDPRAEYEAALHRIDGNGRYGFPAAGFRLGMVRVGKLLGINMIDGQQMFHILAENKENLVEIISDPPVMVDDWINVKRGGADIRYRPYFYNWSAEVPIVYDPDLISLEQIVNLLNHAGWKIGIGDWRPAKNGTNGMYEVVVQ